MSNRIKKFDGGGDVDGGDILNALNIPTGVLSLEGAVDAYLNSLPGGGASTQVDQGPPSTDNKLTSEELRDLFSKNLTGSDIYGDPLAGYEGLRDPVTSFVSAAQASDYLQSILESGDYNVTPEELEARRLGLSVDQMNARTEDMLDSILKSQGETKTGFVDESAKLAAEGILKGKIAQAGVTDPAAAEAALNSAMESLEEGSSGVDAVKAAAAGAQDYLEDLLGSAKDILDKGYDATIGKLPEVLRPSTVGVDPTTGQTTVVFGDPVQGTTVLGGQVGTVGGGTYAGVTTTGNAVLDAVIKAAKDGVDIESVIGAATGLPSDVVSGAVDVVKTAAKELDRTTLDATDDGTDLVLTAGADDTKQNEVTTAGGDAVVQEGVMGPFGGGDTSLDDVIDITMDTATPTGRERVPGLQLPEGGGDDEVDVIDRTPTGRERVPGFQLPARDDEPPILDEEVPEPTPEVPEIPQEIQGYRAVQTSPGESVDIEYLYDIAGPSIFAPKLREEEDRYNPLGMYSPYAEGGIVQDYDIEELIRLLENQRG